jgi:hypothetical protein
MSIERELLKRFMTELNTEEDVVSLFNDIKECLAQPEQTEQEPVAWMYDWEDIPEGDGDSPLLKNFVTNDINMIRAALANNVRPLYTSPPKRKPLSMKQAEDLWETSNFKSAVPYYIFDEIVVAAEKVHGIGGGE